MKSPIDLPADACGPTKSDSPNVIVAAMARARDPEQARLPQLAHPLRTVHLRQHDMVVAGIAGYLAMLNLSTLTERAEAAALEHIRTLTDTECEDFFMAVESAITSLSQFMPVLVSDIALHRSGMVKKWSNEAASDAVKTLNDTLTDVLAGPRRTAPPSSLN